MKDLARIRWPVLAALVSAVAVLAVAGSGAASSGASVAQRLGQVSNVVGGLSGSVGSNGGYGKQENAGAVPFLGGAPGSLLPGVFDSLGGLGGFAGFSPDGDDSISVVKDKVKQVDTALGGSDDDNLVDRVYTCGDADCTDSSKVKDLTRIALHLKLATPTPTNLKGEVDFTSLGLPSLGFVPKDAGKLKIELGWRLDVGIVADGDGLRLTQVPGVPELTFDASISLAKTSFTVNLGALVVSASQGDGDAPSFKGRLLVDLLDDGSFGFAFGDPSGFSAKWHLQTKDTSPIEGVEGDLSIRWNLAQGGLNGGSGLSISVDDVEVDTEKLVGEDLQEAAAAISEVTHPLRTATSPLTEPIPGLSDLTEALDVGEVTMLTIMEEWQDFPPEVQELLTRLRQLDDVVSALEGDGKFKLGSFSLTGGEALKPVDRPLADAAIQGLKKIYDECPECKKTVDELLKTVGRPGGGAGGFQFDLPILREPATLAGLLLGRDVDLITFDTGQLGYPLTHEEIPLARFLIFAAKLAGDLQGTVHIKGGVDTRGIIDALRDSEADVLNGVYLQRPKDGDPVVRLFSGISLRGGVDLEIAEATLGGGPKPDIVLAVPASAPGGKLRPTVKDGAVTDGIGCALLEGGKADFSVHLTATFDYFVGSEEETLAEHTFLTREDLCDKSANNVPVAEDDGNRNVVVNPAAKRGIPADQPDAITVFMTHHPNGAPDRIVVTGNDNKRSEFPAADFDNVRYEASGDARNVIFRVVRNDEKPFEKRVFVETGEGDDDVLVDSVGFGLLRVNGGNDNVIVSAVGAGDAAGTVVSGGPGDDRIIGGNHNDFLGGGDGDDTIDGGGEFDVLTGGTGNDILLDSSPGRNCLSGSEGDDLLISGPGADFLNGDDAFCGADAKRDPEDAGATWGGDDVIVTGGGADVVVAGNGDDTVRLHGEEAEGGTADPDGDTWTAGVIVHGNGGNDRITTGTGDDFVHGGPGNDGIAADSGAPKSNLLRNGGNDTVLGGLGDDEVDAADGGDTVYGDDGKDTCQPPITGQPPEADSAGGADEVYGGDGRDRIALEAGNDTAYGGRGDDVICGHAGADTVEGDRGTGFLELGAGADTVFGGSGGDTIAGGPGDDELFGNAGSDTVNGHDGGDRLVGGSSDATVPDSGDTIDGGDDIDLVIGDNGAVAAGPPRVPSVFNLFTGNATLGGADTIAGGTGDDRAFGGISGDTIRGNDGDDHLEGNDGDDAVHGGGDQDDIVGGTSPESLPNPAAGRTAADAPDTGETILSGGAERDVVVGDNGIITRPGGIDPITGSVARAVTLLDRDRTGAALAAVSGGDYIEGNEQSDRLYGEGGADYVKGNDGDDYAEGNQGADRLEGNDGEDDLVGGSSFASAPGVGDPDAGDRLAGGAGADLLLGDNAAVTRATTGSGARFDWDTVANNWLGPVARRSVTLLDKTTLTAGNFGSDALSGGAEEDVAFGQDGDDLLYGGSHDDYVEGNGGSDAIYGDQVAPATGDVRESGQPQLDGVPGPDGQDDEIGGSSWMRATATDGAITGQRDRGDQLHGDGNADVQLGDNGKVLRRIVAGSYQTYQATTGKPTIVRQAAPNDAAATALPGRFDVGATAGAAVWGDDVLYGGGGDDLQLAEDGNDALYGGADDDDMYGELGNDRLFGEAGEDAMLGDRGVVANRLTSTPDAAFTDRGTPQLTYTPYAAHPLDRRVDMNHDGDGAPLQSPGMTTGGDDLMRGGPHHDAMHGEAGNDLMNGDSGGDYLFGDDGVDVLFGGKGRECADPADLACNSDRGANDSYVDYLFGGRGLKTDPVTGGADILDFRPRPGVDPASWFELTSTRASDPVADHQHHQGIDWVYGGWDRDVMQADVAENGPNQGDRLIDWTGAYNLYTHCPAAYGGFNDVRERSPSTEAFLEKLAYYLGAGKSLADVQTKGTSGYNELALVYSADTKQNSGSAYPATPGHFEEFSCAP